MINTDLVKKGVVVKCRSVEEAKELFDAMGWDKNQNSHSVDYNFYDGDTCRYYWTVGSGRWSGDRGNLSSFKNSIEFSELRYSRLASILGVKEMELFRFGDEYKEVYWIENGKLKSNLPVLVSSNRLSEMINNPDKIKPIPIYSDKTAEDAECALTLGFEKVLKRKDGIVVLTTKIGQNYHVKKDIFSDIPVGESLNLADIMCD